MRLSQARGLRDLGLGQRHDPVRLDDVQRRVQNTSSNVVVVFQIRDFLPEARASASITKMSPAIHVTR